MSKLTEFTSTFFLVFAGIKISTFSVPAATSGYCVSRSPVGQRCHRTTLTNCISLTICSWTIPCSVAQLALALWITDDVSSAWLPSRSLSISNAGLLRILAVLAMKRLHNLVLWPIGLTAFLDFKWLPYSQVLEVQPFCIFLKTQWRTNHQPTRSRMICMIRTVVARMVPLTRVVELSSVGDCRQELPSQSHWWFGCHSVRFCSYRCSLRTHPLGIGGRKVIWYRWGWLRNQVAMECAWVAT